MASTINLANIKLAMETSAIQLGFKIARGEIASLRKAFNDGESDIEKYNRHLDMLNKYFKNSTEDVHIYERALIGLQKRFKQGEFATPAPKSALSSRIEELRSRSTSTDDKYASAMRELWVLKRQLNVTTVEFNRLEDQTAKQFGITTPRMKAQNDALDALAKAEKAAAMSLARHKELLEQSLTPQQKYMRALAELSQLTGSLKPGTAANNHLMEEAAKKYGVVTAKVQAQKDALDALAKAQKAAAAEQSRAAELASRSQTAIQKFDAELLEMHKLRKELKALGVTREDVNRLVDQAAARHGLLTTRMKDAAAATKILADAEKAAATALARHKELTEQSLTPQQKYIRAITEISQLTGRLAPGTAANNRLMEQAAKANGVVTVAIDRHTRALKLKQVQQDYINKGVQQANALLQSAMTMEQRHTAQLNQLTNAYRQGAISIDKYAHSLRQLKKEQGQEVREAGSITTPGGMNLTATAGILAAGAALMRSSSTVKQFILDSRTIASNIETTTLAFDVMSGSAEKAKNMVAELRVLDAKTPISFTGLADASKTLMGYGVAAKTITPILQRLSDVSLGNEDKFKSLALAFGQVKAAGRLMGQEVLQMVNAGFNPLAEIAEQMAKKFGGLSEDFMPKLKKAMEDGQISFAMFEQSIERATSTGGRFFGATERSIETSSGQWAKFISDLQTVQIALGEALGPPTIEMITSLGDALDLLNQSGAFQGLVISSEAIGMSLALVSGNFIEYMQKINKLHAIQAETAAKRKKDQEEFAAFDRAHAEWSTRESEKQWNIIKSAQAKKEREKKGPMLLPTVETAAQAAAKTADEKSVKNFNKQIERIKTEYDERTKGKDKFDRESLLKAMNFNKMDATQKKQLQEALRMQRLNDEAAIAEKAKKEAEKVAKEKKAIADALAKKQAEDVKAMHEKSRTPLTEFHETLKEIKRLQGLGLDAGDAGRAQKDAAEKFQKAQNPDNIARTTAPLIKAGSVEAYKLMDDRKEKQFLVAEQARIIASESLVVQQQIRDALNKDKLVVGMKR